MLNRKIKHTYPSQLSKEFSYDKNNHITNIIKEDKTTITQEYDLATLIHTKNIK